jgi:hypothetical protein
VFTGIGTGRDGRLLIEMRKKLFFVVLAVAVPSIGKVGPPAPGASTSMKLPLIALLIVTACSRLAASAKTNTAAPSVSLCEMVASPDKYEGKRVTVFAVYNYGFEREELLCVECRTVGELTWVKFSDQFKMKDLRKAPKNLGIVSGLFTGVFRRRSNTYGGYKFDLEVDSVSDVRVLVRDTKIPLSAVPKCCDLEHSGK